MRNSETIKNGNGKMKKLLVIFKTHLDIGFTDFSENVVEKYMDEYIPNAICVARELRQKNEGYNFRWTVGSWLVTEYLRMKNSEAVAGLCNAIENGDVCWHGLPFTTHTELMDASLFKYGLSLSKKLDERFKKKTIAAKMTDVPGHTKAMIPYLRQAGIEFLHIGVNPASAVPNVPEIFIWQADSGERITVMYNADYGTFTRLGNTDTAVYFAHTGDNLGGQSASEVMKLFDNLHIKYPDAEIVAADLNDLAVAVREIENNLPVVTDEIGDSWIHGIGTDPKKVAMFKSLERFSEKMPDGEEKEEILRGLLMICEHTWGLNGQMNLADYDNYLRCDFERVRGQDNFKRMEASWAEQRRYLTDAVDCLEGTAKEQALTELSNVRRNLSDISDKSVVEPHIIFKIGGWELAFDEGGSIELLKCADKTVADRNHKLFTPFYEQFSATEYQRFYSKYNRLDVLWAQEDYTKIGMDKAHSSYKCYSPSAKVYFGNDMAVIRYTFPDEAINECGCPAECELLLSQDNNGSLIFDFAWFGKSANRMTEAFWIGFQPVAKNKRIRKLGTAIDPKSVVYKGNRRLHGTDFGVIYDELTIETLDTALIAPGQPSLLDFRQDIPSDDEAVFFNLYNNMWATNFPLWYAEDARFRFVLGLTENGKLVKKS